MLDRIESLTKNPKFISIQKPDRHIPQIQQNLKNRNSKQYATVNPSIPKPEQYL